VLSGPTGHGGGVPGPGGVRQDVVLLPRRAAVAGGGATHSPPSRYPPHRQAGLTLQRSGCSPARTCRSGRAAGLRVEQAQASSRISSVTTAPRALAKPWASPTVRKPSLCRTLTEPRLSLTTRARMGRAVNSFRNASTAAVVTPLPHCDLAVQ